MLHLVHDGTSTGTRAYTNTLADDAHTYWDHKLSRRVDAIGVPQRVDVCLGRAAAVAHQKERDTEASEENKTHRMLN